VCSSDLKNIKVIENALEKVQDLNGYTFERIDIDVGRQTGVIAQEVMHVLPEAVSFTEEGNYTVAYGNMVGLLIESIKELNSQVTTLKAELEKLKNPS
jgi:tetrahydromethanopterin S-methyltransferase subunit G